MEVINISSHFLTTKPYSAEEPFRASSWIIHFSVDQDKFASRESASEFIESSTTPQSGVKCSLLIFLPREISLFLTVIM